jgi:hypothetical protein
MTSKKARDHEDAGDHKGTKKKEKEKEKEKINHKDTKTQRKGKKDRGEKKRKEGKEEDVGREIATGTQAFGMRIEPGTPAPSDAMDTPPFPYDPVPHPMLFFVLLCVFVVNFFLFLFNSTSLCGSSVSLWFTQLWVL